MTKSKLTIQINNLEALERLIGGDSEIEIEIRNSAAKMFAKKHISVLIDKPLLDQVNREVRESYFELDRWSTPIALSSFAKEKLGEFISNIKHKLLWEIAEEVLSEKEVRKQISELLSQQADYIINILTPQMSEKYLDQMIEKRLKERLNIK